MFGDDGEKRPSLLGPTIKTVAVLAGMSWLAAGWLSGASDRQALTQLAGQIGQRDDPVTTGSIATKANATRLDPCSVPRR